MLALRPQSMSCMYKAISKQENAHPEAALLVARDFNAGKLKSVLPHFYQNVKCATRGKRTLDHLYSTHRDAYKALPRPPFGISDHNSILVIPAYKQTQKQEAPVTQSIKSGQMKQMLSCRTRTEWNMFRDSFVGIEEYITSVTGFINKCIDDVVPTVTVSTYPNKKPGITGNIRTDLKGTAAAFKERDSNLEAYKKSRYALQQTIKQAKRQYRTKIE